ncbi:MAG: alkyl hydroperoxide reductase [Burkholderiales bacterium RIFCSPHIGHO2_01_FULL_63_240]|jgi:peroxiredoxin|nr:MAG: alkyl hydroperoxide reductase [Burkholderiales bacterium RIFCSPHIGHO2_01_FULL_63_240]
MSFDIEASEWLNTAEPLSLPALRGRVVLVSAFQMLCRGCATLSLPQARNLHLTFSRDDLVVIGLHSVFEHQHVMTPDALRAFVHEYRLPFPIAIDRPREGSLLPETMRAWALEGTPTLMVFDRDGQLALQHFGHLDDLRLGALLGGLIERPPGACADASQAPAFAPGANAGAVCIPL